MKKITENGIEFIIAERGQYITQSNIDEVNRSFGTKVNVIPGVEWRDSTPEERNEWFKIYQPIIDVNY